jgi:hypothetical protein
MDIVPRAGVLKVIQYKGLQEVDLTVHLMFEGRLYGALIMNMPEGNFDMEFKTAVWNLTIFQIMFTLENKLQDTRRSPRKDGSFVWFHLIGYQQRYHPDCCRSDNHHRNIFHRHLQPSKACSEQIRTSEKKSQYF